MFKNIAKNREIWAFDCEWVPDPVAGRVLYNLSDEMSEREVMEVMWKEGGATDKDPQPYLKTVMCRVVSIAAVTRSLRPDGSAKIELRSYPDNIPACKDYTLREDVILTGFLGGVGENKPQLVGFNSESADLKTLIQRAIVNGVSSPKFCERPNKKWEGIDYFDRYSNDHIDLKEDISGWGKATPSLHELATLSGIPGKMDVDGKGVAEMWLNDDLKGIVAYNECDALTTYLVWLRAAHFAGFFTQEGYEDEQALVHQLIARRGDKHLADYAKEWDRLCAATMQV